MVNIGMGQKLARSQKNRVSTGISGLDALLHGGLPQGSITLVSGTPGTGKTILCFQFIQAGLANKERCLYFTSDERIENLFGQGQELGFDFHSALENNQLKVMYLNLDKHEVHKEMEEAIRTGGYTRVVLDSLTPLSEVPIWVLSKGTEIIPSEDSMVSTQSVPLDSVQAMRMHVRRLMGILNVEGCTTLVTSEVPEGSRNLSRDTISEFLADGIILLDLDSTMDRRKLTIRKMRRTRHTLKPHDIQIDAGGIKFL